jgi:hypothetical protein
MRFMQRNGAEAPHTTQQKTKYAETLWSEKTKGASAPFVCHHMAMCGIAS